MEKVKFRFGYITKKSFYCSECNELMRTGEPYFSYTSTNGYDMKFLKVCEKCFKPKIIDKINTAIKEIMSTHKKYLKNGGFEYYMREQMASIILKASKRGQKKG